MSYSQYSSQLAINIIDQVSLVIVGVLVVFFVHLIFIYDLE